MVWATEISHTTHYSGVLAFSVGCHSGLNVLDAAGPITLTTDWAQAFTRQGATFVGNTGFGYGDADLLAYSERLMLYFVEELGYWPGGQPPTVGQALLRAKQRYYNSLAAGTLSNYDEKVIGQATLYGMPMMAVHVPSPVLLPGAEPVGDELNLSLEYTLVAGGQGSYYVVNEQAGAEAQGVGARPVVPRLSYEAHFTDTVVHGVLMLGGTFSETTYFDPLISRVVTDQVYADLALEPTYDADRWYPTQIATVNRFLGADGQSRDRIVVVPAQFKPDPAASTPTQTIGTQRLYTDLEFEVYRAPLTATDYIAPSIWQVRAISSSLSLKFRVQVTDDGEAVQRVVLLYQLAGDNHWSNLEMDYDSATGWAEASIPPVSGPVYYFAQAVDASGNVALALDHGNPFTQLDQILSIYLPVILKDAS